jgi:hypothetical protein
MNIKKIRNGNGKVNFFLFITGVLEMHVKKRSLVGEDEWKLNTNFSF